MGGCSSIEEPSNTPPSSEEGGNKEPVNDSVATEINKIASSWQHDTLKIWARSFDQLAIHTDMPRLAHKMEVVTVNGREDDLQITETMTQEEVIYYVFCKLAGALESEEQLELIKEKYKDYVKGSGDISQQILKFLGDVINDNSKMMKVLKACHQKILLPGYYFIKSQIYENYPFKDFRGSWGIKIVVNNEEVTVTHKKRQQSNSETDGSPDFEFDWELRIIFDRAVQRIQYISAKVISTLVNDKLSDEKKQHIHSIFDNLSNPEYTFDSSDDI